MIDPHYLRVVCWKWHERGYRSEFVSRYANVLYRMIKLNYQSPFEMVCITDNPDGLHSDIRTIPLWNDWRECGRCTVRLKLFSKEMRYIIGPRIVSVDLDVVITGDITSLWDTHEEFKINAIAVSGQPYNGGMFIMDAGSRRQVWEKFNGISSMDNAHRLGYKGSDQAWLPYILGPDEPTWGPDDGVYSYRGGVRRNNLPENAKMVFFQGVQDPWDREAQRESPWIKKYWK